MGAWTDRTRKFSVRSWIRGDSTLHWKKRNSHRVIIVYINMSTIRLNSPNNMARHSQCLDETYLDV